MTKGLGELRKEFDSFKFKVGYIEFDLFARALKVRNKEVHLSESHYQFFLLVAAGRGEPVSHTALKKFAFAKPPKDNFYKVNVHRLYESLRGQINNPGIVPVYKVGYRLHDQLLKG